MRIFTHDFSQPIVEELAREIGSPDYIVHIGAETHVDNSIKNPMPFVKSNVLGTVEILNYARTLPGLKKFIYFSTDEVFGPAPKGVSYKEWDRYNSTNPYAASKAAGEEFCLAFSNSYGIPLLITHCMNCYGERQHKEKLVPIIMRKVLNGEKLTVHCTDGEPASRSWIHARNISSAVLFLLNEEVPLRDKYNISGQIELNVLEIAERIAAIIGKPLNYEKTNYYNERPGHDPRYMLDGSKLASLGWHLPVDFDHSLEKTVKWTLENDRWLK